MPQPLQKDLVHHVIYPLDTPIIRVADAIPAATQDQLCLSSDRPAVLHAGDVLGNLPASPAGVASPPCWRARIPGSIEGDAHRWANVIVVAITRNAPAAS